MVTTDDPSGPPPSAAPRRSADGGGDPAARGGTRRVERADRREDNPPDQPSVETRGLRVNPKVTIPTDELHWQFSGSGGPGGQHANTANTRAEVSWEVETSTALDDDQRARLMERLGSTVRVVASDTRSQLRNRELALERLRSRVAAALVVRPRRRATTPGRAAVQRRLDAKRRRSVQKRDRAGPAGDDD